MSTSEGSSANNMPALVEQPKHEKPMMEALRILIMRDREKKRLEEEEADKALEAKKQEQERQRKKREAESLNLEQTKEQIKTLEEKRKALQNEKHELFLKLKIVLNEDENRRKQQQKEKSEMMTAAYNHHQYHPAMPHPGSHMLVTGGSMHSRPTLLGDKSQLFKAQTTPVQGIKRNRSPSPVRLYPQQAVQAGHYPQAAFSQVQAASSPFRPQGRAHPPYTSAQASSTAFISQAVSGAAGYPHGQQPGLHGTYSASAQSNPAKYQAREAHFPQIPLHYPVHKGQGDSFPQGFQGYTAGTQHVQAAAIDQATKQSVYNEEKSRYQSQLQEQHLRQITAAAQAQAALHSQQAHSNILSQQQQQAHLQQAQSKALSSSYPPRRKQDSPVYPSKKPMTQRGPAYQSAQGQARSSAYPSQGHGQQGGRFY